MLRLADRVAVITGAGSGIGRATAERFATEGARVVLSTPTKRLPVRSPRRSTVWPWSATSRTRRRRPRFRAAFEAYGSVDIAFNNAGISPLTTTPSWRPDWTPGDGCRR